VAVLEPVISLLLAGVESAGAAPWAGALLALAAAAAAAAATA
jgi:hypothetical protein